MDLKGRNILVAGAGGNLGRHVVNDLAPLCKSIIAVDRAFPEPFASSSVGAYSRGADARLSGA